MSNLVTKYLNINYQFLWIVLFLTTLAPVILGALTPFILLILMAIYSIIIFIKSPRPNIDLDIIGKAFIFVFIVQIILAIISAKTINDIFFFLNFLPLLFYIPASAILKNINVKNPIRIFATISLLGTFGALLVGLIAIYIFHNARASYGFVNANDLSGFALLFGFLSLVGMVEHKGKMDFLYLFGPLLAFATILITGSRGAFLAFIPMLFIAAWFLIPNKFRLPALFALLIVVALSIFIMISFFQIDRFVALVEIAKSLVNGESVADSSTNQRLLLFAAGIKAFLQAPIFGHGWGNLMQVVAPFIPDVPQRNAALSVPQLHNDIINFAVTGGVIGVATYLIILIAPIIAVWRSANDKYKRARKIGIMLLLTCYSMRGLTDLMIGFEYGTTFYVTSLALIIGFLREKPA